MPQNYPSTANNSLKLKIIYYYLRKNEHKIFKMKKKLFDKNFFLQNKISIFIRAVKIPNR